MNSSIEIAEAVKLADKLIAKAGARAVACFVPPYMAEAYRARRQGWARGRASLPSTGAGVDGCPAARLNSGLPPSAMP